MNKFEYSLAGAGLGFIVGLMSGSLIIGIVGAIMGVIVGVAIADANEKEERRQKQKEKAIEDYNREKAEREKAEQKKSAEINDLFDQIEKDNWGYRKWERLNELNPEYRQDKICIEYIERVKNLYFKSYAYFVYMGNYEINHLSFGLKDLLAIPETQNEAQILLTHADYFNAISDRLKSIFTDCLSISDMLKKIEIQFETKYPELTPPEIVAAELALYQDVFDEAQIEMNNYNYFKVLRLVLWCDKDINSLKKLSELLIYDSLVTSKTDVHLKNSNTLKNIYQRYFTKLIPYDYRKEEGEYYYPSIDLIAAQAIVYSRGNIVDYINKSLDIFLDMIGKDGLEVSQYEALRKIFEYLKAYKQEEKVLETMFENNVARSPEQEARLAFLKQRVPIMLDVINKRASEGEVLYDYRSVKWNTQEVRSYFDVLTMNSEVLTMPMVVKEWGQNIFINNMKWDTKEVGSAIERGLINNFGDQFQVQYIKGGASTIIETITDPAIYISETKTMKNNYPWLAFIVKNEQIILNQVNIAIYVLFMPENVELKGSSCSQKNTELCNMFLVLKEEQNPKINNFLTTMSKVLDQEIKNWFEKNTGDFMY